LTPFLIAKKDIHHGLPIQHHAAALDFGRAQPAGVVYLVVFVGYFCGATFGACIRFRTVKLAQIDGTAIGSLANGIDPISGRCSPARNASPSRPSGPGQAVSLRRGQTLNNAYERKKA
jgi:hypothetical protein